MFAQDICHCAAELVSTDQQLGGRVDEALRRLSDYAFVEQAESHTKDSGVQLVDVIIPIQPPEPGRLGEPDRTFRGPTSGGIRDVLEKLPQGDRPWVREVRSSEELQRLWKWLEKAGTDDPSRYGDPSRGTWKNLPDGSGVGRRNAAGSTGRPAIDINLNESGHWKIHINPSTGGLPNLPMTQPRPVDATPNRGSAPAGGVPPAIAETPAAPRVPAPRPGGMGGVVPDGMFPGFVDAPGPEAGAPDLPVLGDGDRISQIPGTEGG